MLSMKFCEINFTDKILIPTIVLKYLTVDMEVIVILKIIQ